jgi:hypothetical protein
MATPAIPALWRLRQEHHEFKASLGYTESPVLKINKQVNKLGHYVKVNRKPKIPRDFFVFII